MKFSIVTVVFNARNTVEKTINSVLSQKNVDIEYIVVDGGSTDGCAEYLLSRKNLLSHLISEPDRGIYDAMNKGLKLCSGDIIGFINADDYYEDDFVLDKVLKVFLDANVDAVYGDLVYFSAKTPNKISRYYNSKTFSPNRLKYGIMPAHPALFFKKSIYQTYGFFDPNFKIAGDFEFLARVFSSGNVSYKHIPLVLVRMQLGGVSNKNIKSAWIINNEIFLACKKNDVNASIFSLIARYLVKILEIRFIKR